MEENEIQAEEEVKKTFPIICEKDQVTVVGESTVENSKGYWCGNCYEKRELEAALERKENFTNHNLSEEEVKAIVDRVAEKSPETFADLSFDERVMKHVKENVSVKAVVQQREELAAESGVAVNEVHGK